ncbi:MAG TPA: CYTH domain-containing protein [Rudaea sp.]|jgi:adenylate cyclase
MATEIERKFLVVADDWRASVVRSQPMEQGYLTRTGAVDGPSCSVRVRIAGDAAWLNIKSAIAGVERREYEYAVPVPDAARMLAEFCPGVVEKIRHYVPLGGRTFEVDEFLGDNTGLIVAELELDAVDARFERPSWLGREVSAVSRYYNLHLLNHPYSRWSAVERAGE